MNAPAQPAILKCPVCGASFRGSATCSRCRTDLEPLMRIAVKAWEARRQARRHLQSGDLLSAMRCSTAAWKLHHCGPRPVPMEPRIDAIGASDKPRPQEPHRSQTLAGPETFIATDTHQATQGRNPTPITLPTPVKKRATGWVRSFFRLLSPGKRHP